MTAVTRIHPESVLEDGTVSSAQVVDQADISYRQLDYWTRTGLLHAIEDTPGSGIARGYPEAAIEKAKTIKDLLDAGMALQNIRKVIDDFLTDGHVTVGHITIARADQEAQ